MHDGHGDGRAGPLGRVRPVPAETLAARERRHTDLQAEAWALVHVHHTFSADEHASFNEMLRELEAVSSTISSVEGEANPR